MNTNPGISCHLLDVPFKGYDVVALEDEHGIHVIQDEQLIKIYLSEFQNYLGIMLKRCNDVLKTPEYLNKQGEWKKYDPNNEPHDFAIVLVIPIVEIEREFWSRH